MFICCSKQNGREENSSEHIQERKLSVSGIENTEDGGIKKSISSDGYNSIENMQTVHFDSSKFHFAKPYPPPSAHKKYLNEPLQFEELSGEDFSSDQTAVVGSRECFFYAGASVSTQKDADELKADSKSVIPFGAIIPIIGGFIQSTDSDYDGAFKLGGHYNFFYRTKWQDKEGLVFGAHLCGADAADPENAVTALLYKTGGVFKNFYPVSGYKFLTEEQISALQKDRIIFQKVDKSEYNLNAEKPDDMLSLYINHIQSVEEPNNPKKNQTPFFITTDLMAHCKHLVFDKILQEIEENFFMPALKILVDGFLYELSKVNGKGAVTANEETLTKAKEYFLTARAMLELAPQKTEEDDDEENQGNNGQQYIIPDFDEIAKKYPKTVQEEIALIYNSKSVGARNKSAIFTFKDGSYIEEDYSQFTPRRHYTKNGALSAYFKAMMWFGRIHFLIAEGGVVPQPDERGQMSSGAAELTPNMQPIALLITELVKNNPSLYSAWENLFNPITDIIGFSDDLSLKEVLPLLKSFNVKDFKAWSADKKNLAKFLKEAHKKLKPPAISGNPLLSNASESFNGKLKPPMGWRLFGQRFTYDSFIHTIISSPKILGRLEVSGLDIMKAFGSKTADELLQKDNFYKEIDGRLKDIQKEVSESPASAFGNTYYGHTLNEIALQAQFEQGSGFYFTETPAWSRKALLSAHGTWAELRHDTILYAKQSFAEMGGYGDWLTFSTEPLPAPIHYIEPNLAFWQNAAVSSAMLKSLLEKYGFDKKEEISDSLDSLKNIAEKAAEIVRLEIEDKQVPQEDINWIATIPAELGRLILPWSAFIEDERQLSMACIADVFTSSAGALETGIGIPYRIYVALNDSQGGKRIATGYCFNYYEFMNSSRLTDEEWKSRVYDSGTPLENLKPFWAQNISLKPEKDSY